MDETQLVLGSIRGYRVWRVRHRKLWPMRHGMDSLTASTMPYTAVCALYDKSNREHGPSPHPQCSCGFYARYEAPGLAGLANGQYLDYYGLAAGTYVLGSVQMTGTVIKGGTGVMRAEKMTIETLAAPYPLCERGGLEALADAYGVPLRTVSQMVTEYPLENRSVDTDIAEAIVVNQLRDAVNHLRDIESARMGTVHSMHIYGAPVARMTWPSSVPPWAPTWIPRGSVVSWKPGV